MAMAFGCDAGAGVLVAREPEAPGYGGADEGPEPEASGADAPTSGAEPQASDAESSARSRARARSSDESGAEPDSDFPPEASELSDAEVEALEAQGRRIVRKLAHITAAEHDALMEIASFDRRGGWRLGG